METGKIKIKTVLVSLAVIVAIEVIARFAVSGRDDNLLLILGVARFLETIFIALTVLIPEGSISSIGLTPPGMFFDLKRGLIWRPVSG
ncbi:MAG: hypothetical protein J7L71_11150 [Spirochaetaceae bacterium]|nr:hypothetical protein [Spirochaetaceae bacterium]